MGSRHENFYIELVRAGFDKREGAGTDRSRRPKNRDLLCHVPNPARAPLLRAHLSSDPLHIQIQSRQCKQIAVKAVQKSAVPRDQATTILDRKIALEGRLKEIARLSKNGDAAPARSASSGQRADSVPTSIATSTAPTSPPIAPERVFFGLMTGASRGRRRVADKIGGDITAGYNRRNRQQRQMTTVKPEDVADRQDTQQQTGR